jgi:hypothetical protein
MAHTLSSTLQLAVTELSVRPKRATILLWQMVMGLTPAEWRSQSIYFLLTDRFGRTDNHHNRPNTVIMYKLRFQDGQWHILCHRHYSWQ